MRRISSGQLRKGALEKTMKEMLGPPCGVRSGLFGKKSVLNRATRIIFCNVPDARDLNNFFIMPLTFPLSIVLLTVIKYAKETRSCKRTSRERRGHLLPVWTDPHPEGANKGEKSTNQRAYTNIERRFKRNAERERIDACGKASVIVFSGSSRVNIQFCTTVPFII